MIEIKTPKVIVKHIEEMAACEKVTFTKVQ